MPFYRWTRRTRLYMSSAASPAQDICTAKWSDSLSPINILGPFRKVISHFFHMTQLGCRVVGPLVVVFCLQQQHCVPKAEKPVYNMAMADVTISCTSLDKAARVSVHIPITLQIFFPQIGQVSNFS